MTESAPHEGRILIVDDEPSLRDVLKVGLTRSGFFVASAASHTEALGRLDHAWDLVITDLQLPDGDGLSILGRVKELAPDTAVIVLTAHGSADTAVAAMKLGAHDYLTKPFDLDELRIRARQAIEGGKLRRENRELRAQVGARSGIQGLVGKATSMRDLIERIRAVANSSSTVLVTGESGTGKELVARAIHDLSARRGRPFVAINCGAIAESLLESEMFGHVKGAFTDARQSRPGVFEQANTGTLLLDEIGEMPLSMQVKLLRVLQERKVRRVGGSDEVPIDVRIIAATHRDLRARVREGTFRDDLFYRIDVIQIPVPPLRDRIEDVPLLVSEFSSRLAGSGAVQRKTFDSSAMAELMRHSWPGNVRELENVVERALTLTPGESVTATDLSIAPVAMSRSTPDPFPGFSLQEYLSRTEQILVKRAMELSGDKRPEASRLLGITPRALKYLLSKSQG